MARQRWNVRIRRTSTHNTMSSWVVPRCRVRVFREIVGGGSTSRQDLSIVQ